MLPPSLKVEHIVPFEHSPKMRYLRVVFLIYTVANKNRFSFSFHKSLVR